MEFVIVSGMSGAGKSKAASFLEDMGFYVVDNLPAPLIPNLAQHCQASGQYERVALVTDIRGGQNFDSLFEALDALKTMLGISPKVKLVAPKSIARSEGKAVRVIDKRKI